ACPPSLIAHCPRHRWETWTPLRWLQAHICSSGRVPCLAHLAYLHLQMAYRRLILSSLVAYHRSERTIESSWGRRSAPQVGCSMATAIMTRIGTLRTLYPRAEERRPGRWHLMRANGPRWREAA